MVSVMAASGIAEADWYALAKQAWFPNMELYDPATGTTTPAGATFAFMQTLLARGDVQKVPVDDFTYMYKFGDNAAIVWGTPRTLQLGADVTAYDLSGKPITNFSGTVDKAAPVVLVSSNVIKVGGNVTLGATNIVGDSFDQFDVSNAIAGSTAGFEGPWSYFVEASTGQRTALQTMGGGLLNGEQWTPYLGLTWLRPLYVNAESLNPADFSNGTNPAASYKVVERYSSAAAQTVTIAGHWDVQDSSSDGITLKITKGNQTLVDRVIFDPAHGNIFDFKLTGVVLQKGETIDFVVGANYSSQGGDVTDRHITI